MEEKKPPQPIETTAFVVRSTGSWYDVVTDRGERVRARIRGRFRLKAEELNETNPIAVGDRVMIQTEVDGTSVITDILPRKNQVSRRAAGHKAGKEHVLIANVDAAWVVQSTFDPKFNPGFVDRFLIAAGMYHVPAGLIINKVDLLEGTSRAKGAITFWAELYEHIGYPVLLTSATEREGLETLSNEFENRLSILSGPSGVGKSSLLNAIDQNLDLKTAAVSKKTHKGAHTTTFTTLFPISGGWVADTPGIREFGLWNLEPEELGGYFVEFLPYLDDCRFSPCTHDHEPGCAVHEAVDAGSISQERYAGYLNILRSLQQRKPTY